MLMKRSWCYRIWLLVGMLSLSVLAQENKLTIRADQTGPVISKYIYGHFSEHLGRCCYEGYWVGEDSAIPNVRGIRSDVVEALKDIQCPVIRWPGGCFADEYHWREGIGPRDQRKPMLNTHWGMVVENNHFGTHEFMDLCEQIGCDAYISGNVGSGTVEEMQDWVEYLNFGGDSEMANLRRANGRDEPWKVKFFGVGNENWGCGGNMTAEYYSDLFKRYATYVKDYPGSRVTKVACGPGDVNYNWMDVCMKNIGGRMNAISMHWYVFSGDWGNKGEATRFSEQQWFGVLEKTVEVDGAIKRYKEIMDRYDSRKRIGLFIDEYGTWWNAEPGSTPGFLYQQNTLRDAVVAGVFLNIFNAHADRVRMANIAQTNNVLQAMILTDGPRMMLTPTYHLFRMYNGHHDGRAVAFDLSCAKYEVDGKALDTVSASVSKNAAGEITISLVNLDPKNAVELSCEIEGGRYGQCSGEVLTSNAMNTHNTFERPDAISPTAFKDFKLKENMLSVTLPSKSVVVLTLK